MHLFCYENTENKFLSALLIEIFRLGKILGGLVVVIEKKTG